MLQIIPHKRQFQHFYLNQSALFKVKRALTFKLFSVKIWESEEISSNLWHVAPLYTHRLVVGNGIFLVDEICYNEGH